MWGKHAGPFLFFKFKRVQKRAQAIGSYLQNFPVGREKPVDLVLCVTELGEYADGELFPDNERGKLPGKELFKLKAELFSGAEGLLAGGNAAQGVPRHVKAAGAESAEGKSPVIVALEVYPVPVNMPALEIAAKLVMPAAGAVNKPGRVAVP